MRAKDWRDTPLGPMDAWPRSLRGAASICLASRFPIVVWWGEGMVTLYNDAYVPMLGAKHPAALGAKGRDVWPEVWHIIGPLLDAVLHHGESTWSDDQLLPLRRHGFVEECYFTFSCSPVRDEAGEAGGIFTVVTETTARVISARRTVALRRLAECATRAWRSSAELCREAADVMSENPADLPFALLYLLEDAHESLRLAETAGVPSELVSQLSAPDAQPFAADAIAEAIRSGSPQRVSDLGMLAGVVRGPWPETPREAMVFPLAGGRSERPYGALVAGISARLAYDDEYEGFLRLVAGQVATALTSARTHEEERRRTESLAELDRAKLAFFSNVSHDHRTPLRLVIGNIEQLLSGTHGRLSSAQRSSLDMARRNAYRLLKLTNALLDFGRIEAGQLQGSFEPVDLPSVTAGIASSFRTEIERARLRFIVDCPPSPDDQRVHLDLAMWEEIIRHLLSNAYEHTFEGEIAISTRLGEGRAELLVRDTGVGIPAEALPRIFERFHRVPEVRSRTHEGAGIGLALVRELVKLHGGTIDVTSTVGVGTTCAVVLPLGVAHLPSDRIRGSGPAAGGRSWPAPVAEPMRRMPATEDSGSEPAPNTGRILVVDDSADMRAFVARLLLERGWTVEVAADGRQALRLVHERHPDLVVSDSTMPGLDGFDLVRALAADPATREVPIVLLSACEREASRVDGVEARAADHLVRPFAVKEFLACVDAQMQRSRRRAEELRGREERRLRLSIAEEVRARLQRLFAQAPAAIAVLNGPDHVFEFANDVYEELVGRRDILGKPAREALPEFEGEGFLELLDDVYRDGEPVVGHAVPMPRRSSDAERLDERFSDFVYQPIHDEAGVCAIFVYAVDVTEQVLARRRAKESNHAKGDLLTAMGNELRTPLNALDGYLQLLELGIPGPVNGAQLEIVGRLRKSSHRLVALADDMLQFGQLEAGRLEFDLESVRVADRIAAITPLIDGQVAARGLTYVTHADSRLTARADRDRLEQILITLISNAISATPAGGRITVAAGVTATSARRAVCIDVADTGAGIPTSMVGSIFDPFVHGAPAPLPPARGTGLGLAISRDLARGMGGDLTVTTSEGRGSVFRLTLPPGEE